jgi:hypothetical protein
MKYKIVNIKYRNDEEGPIEMEVNEQDLLEYKKVKFINNSGEMENVSLNLALYLMAKNKFDKEIVACDLVNE